MLKKLLCTVFVLSCVGSLLAADPWVGTWKVNVKKSKFVPGRELKEGTLTIAEQGDDIALTLKGTGGNGQPVSAVYTIPSKGGVAKFTEGGPPPGAIFAAKRIDANTVEFTTTMNGKQVQTDRVVLSKNGKSFVEMSTGIDPQGKPVSAKLVFDRR